MNYGSNNNSDGNSQLGTGKQINNNNLSYYYNQVNSQTNGHVKAAPAMTQTNLSTTPNNNINDIGVSNYWKTVTPDQPWSRPQSQSPSPQLPTLNGSPWHGGPATSSPSPVGSRASNHSSSSPPHALSAAGSPNSNFYQGHLRLLDEHNHQQRLNNCYPSRRSSESRSSDEQMNGGFSLTANITNNGRRASESRSSDDQPNYQNYYNCGNGTRRASESRSSDDQPNYQHYYSNYYPTSRSSDSRSSDEQPSYPHTYYPASRSSESRSSSDLNIENLVSRLLRIGDPESLNEVNRPRLPMVPNFYQPNRCRDCTREFFCDACANVYEMVKDRLEDPSEQSRQSLLDLMPNSTDEEQVPINAFIDASPSRNKSSASQGITIQTNEPIVEISVSSPQNGLTAPIVSINSPLVFHNQRVLAAAPILYCDIHQDAQRFYCQTCSRPFCSECGLQYHVGHATIHLVDAAENAEAQASQVLNEAVCSVATIREDLDNIQTATGTLEAKVREATALVMDMTKRLAAALEAREKELLDQIEKARIHKIALLKTREEGLNFGLVRLNKTVETLAKCVEQASLASNPLDLYVAKDMASAQIFQIKTIRHNLPPPEEHFIKFQAVENSAIDAIMNVGNVVFDTGHIGDRRVLSRPVAPMAPPAVIHPGRAVSDTDGKITVTMNRRRVNNNPYITIGRSIRSLGNKGDAQDTVCRPWGVACDKEGHIVIADRSNNRIQIYHENGTFIRRFGTHGTGPGQFDRPAGLAIDSRRRIIVADKDNHRIQALTMEGQFLLSFGEKGVGSGQFNYPWDVAVNEGCQIVVSDTRNHRIQLFSAEGVYLRKFGFDVAPQLWKHFDSPRGVAFNPEGNVVVTDFNNHRVVVVDSNFMNAKLLGYDSFVPNGPPPKLFLRPQGVVVDDEGNIIVADSRNHRIQIFDQSGVCRWRFGTQGTGPDQMDRPSGVALTPDGKIVVVDFGNNRILLF